MTPQFIERLVRRVEACSTIGELEYETDDAKLVLRFGQLTAASTGSSDGTHASTTASHPVSEAVAANGTVLRAPATGVIRSTHPLSEHPPISLGAPFVEGQQLAFLQVGSVVCGVEADGNGVLGKMLASDGDIVGFGEALFELR